MPHPENSITRLNIVLGQSCDTDIGPTLGTLAIFQVRDVGLAPLPVARDQVMAWAKAAGITSLPLPPTVSPVEAFKSATSGLIDQYEVDGVSYLLQVEAVAGKWTQPVVWRHVMRITQPPHKGLPKRVADLKFFRPKEGGPRGNLVRGTERLRIQVDRRLVGVEAQRVQALVDRAAARYEAYRHQLSTGAMRVMLRQYFQNLGGVTAAGMASAFLTPLPYTDPALTGIRDLVERAGCPMTLFPLPPTDDLRRLIARSVDRDVYRRARLLSAEIDAAVKRASKAPSPLRSSSWNGALRSMMDVVAHYMELSDEPFTLAVAALEELQQVIEAALLGDRIALASGADDDEK